MDGPTESRPNPWGRSVDFADRRHSDVTFDCWGGAERRPHEVAFSAELRPKPRLRPCTQGSSSLPSVQTRHQSSQQTETASLDRPEETIKDDTTLLLLIPPFQ